MFDPLLYLLPTTYLLRLIVDRFDMKQSQFPKGKLVTRQIYSLMPDHQVDGSMPFSTFANVSGVPSFHLIVSKAKDTRTKF